MCTSKSMFGQSTIKYKYDPKKDAQKCDPQ